MRTIIFTIAIAIAAGCSGIYEPCDTKDDCDLDQADACVHILGGPPAFCSLVCQTSKDCPEGPEGQLPQCIPVGKARVCSL